MLEMKITITAPDLAAAINNLAAAMNNGSKTAPVEKQAAPVASAPAAQPATAPVNPNPTPAPTVNPTIGQDGAHLTSATTAPPVSPVPPTVANPAPVAPAPVQQAPVTQQPYVAPATQVPTAAPTFTLEAIATAGTALVDAGKMDLLMGVLAKYGIDSITKLDPSQYGIFATELRALGAQI